MVKTIFFLFYFIFGVTFSKRIFFSLSGREGETRVAIVALSPIVKLLGIGLRMFVVRF